MSKPVLQTKFVGYAPNPQRLHDTRPELVYQVMEPPPLTPSRRTQDARSVIAPFPWRFLIAPIVLLLLRALLNQ